MVRVLLLIVGVLVMGGVSCEGLLTTPTSRSSLDQNDALSIFQTAEENLRAATSFRVTITAEGQDAGTQSEADIPSFGGGRYVIEALFDASEKIEIEVIQVGESRYALYPGFQAWLDLGGEAPFHDLNFKGFPYDLGGVRETAESFDLLGEGVIDGEGAYRITARGARTLREAVGFAPGLGEVEMMIWISKTGVLPLRIEARVEDPEIRYTSVYSDYGSEEDVSVPENVIHVGLMDGLMEGALSPEQLGQVVRALPVPGQQCMESELGTGAYREVIGGDSEEDLLVLAAFNQCSDEIFP